MIILLVKIELFQKLNYHVSLDDSLTIK